MVKKAVKRKLNTMVYRLFYMSRCTIREAFDAESVSHQIAEHASIKNSLVDITGAMTFDGNDFAQILEGRKSDVLAVFNTIKDDPRHDQVSIIREQQIVPRHYNKWAMKVLDSSNYDELVRVMS